MSDWRTTELFIARSDAQHGAFTVGLAIAALGNRRDDGWTHASLDRIAKLARLDRRSAFRAINELADFGELEYVPGTSRYNPSRYRIRTEALSTGVDRFRCSLTSDKTPSVTDDILPSVTDDILDTDRRQFVNQSTTYHAPTDDKTPSISVNRVLTELDQISDQSAREPARFSDPTKSWNGLEEADGALKASLEACRRSAGRSTGEGFGAEQPNAGISDQWISREDADRIARGDTP